jgi:anti-anti-sigma factor
MRSGIERRIKKFNEQNTRLEVAYHYREEGIPTLVFYLRGDLDTQNSHTFIDLFESIEKEGLRPERVVADCSGLEYISSTGIGSFTTILIKCRIRGISFSLSRLSDKVWSVLSDLGFDRYFHIVDDPLGL